MKLIAGNANKKGHYSPGVLVGNILYISGQLPMDPETGQLVAGGIEAQTKAALGNVERVLTTAGLSKETVALCRVYIPNVRRGAEVGPLRVGRDSILLPLFLFGLECTLEVQRIEK